jgi:hypothetical protein
MNLLFNVSQQLILIKDLSGMVNFNNVEDELSKLEYKKNINNEISIDKNFFDKDIFADSKKAIEDECSLFLTRTLNVGDFYQDLKMTNSWANKTEPGQNHHEHVHPFSVVSGVIYLDNNPSNLNLFIESYLPQVPYFITKNKTYASLNALIKDQQIDPATINNLQYHMVLFLSNQHHFVEEIPTDMPWNRRSLSFNTFWSGLTGVKEDSLASYTF